MGKTTEFTVRVRYAMERFIHVRAESEEDAERKAGDRFAGSDVPDANDTFVEVEDVRAAVSECQD